MQEGQWTGLILLGQNGRLQLLEDDEREAGQRLVEEESEQVPPRPHQDPQEGGVVQLPGEDLPLGSCK